MIIITSNGNGIGTQVQSQSSHQIDCFRIFINLSFQFDSKAFYLNVLIIMFVHYIN